MALRFRYPELSLVYNAVPVHQDDAALLVSQPFLKQLTLSDLFRSLCTGGRPTTLGRLLAKSLRQSAARTTGQTKGQRSLAAGLSGLEAPICQRTRGFFCGQLGSDNDRGGQGF